MAFSRLLISHAYPCYLTVARLQVKRAILPSIAQGRRRQLNRAARGCWAVGRRGDPDVGEREAEARGYSRTAMAVSSKCIVLSDKRGVDRSPGRLVIKSSSILALASPQLFPSGVSVLARKPNGENGSESPKGIDYTNCMSSSRVAKLDIWLSFWQGNRPPRTVHEIDSVDRITWVVRVSDIPFHKPPTIVSLPCSS